MKSKYILVAGSLLAILLVWLWYKEIISEPIAALGAAIVVLAGYLLQDGSEGKKKSKSKQQQSGSGNIIQRDDNTTNTYGQIIAPNASIVTSGQSGGTNTVIHNTEPQPPNVSVENWVIRNVLVNQIQHRNARRAITLPSNEIPFESLFHNQITVSYQAAFSRNRITFLIKRTDVKFGSASKSGMLMLRTVALSNGWFGYSIETPQNGIYTLNLYTVEPIDNIQDQIDYQL